MKTLHSRSAKVFVLLLFIFFLGGCASSPPATDTESTPLTVDMDSTPLYDLEQNDMAREKLEGFFKGQWNEEPFALKIPKGVSLPVHINVDTPVAHLDGDAGSLYFKKDVYVYLDKDNALASPDAENWAPFSDLELLKKLFNGEQGSLGLSINETNTEELMLYLSLFLSEKKAPAE